MVGARSTPLTADLDLLLARGWTLVQPVQGLPGVTAGDAVHFERHGSDLVVIKTGVGRVAAFLASEVAVVPVASSDRYTLCQRGVLLAQVRPRRSA